MDLNYKTQTINGKVYAYIDSPFWNSEKNAACIKEITSARLLMAISCLINFKGKLFVQFIALELISCIKKQTDVHSLFKNHTMQSLLDTLDIIAYYQQPGKKHHMSEITEKQRELYEFMGFKAPV